MATLDGMLSKNAKELSVSEDDLLQQGIRRVLEDRLRRTEAELFELASQYGVATVDELDEQYHAGTLEEAGSWRDLQQMDHLEYERDRLRGMIRDVAA